MEIVKWGIQPLWLHSEPTSDDVFCVFLYDVQEHEVSEEDVCPEAIREEKTNPKGTKMEPKTEPKRTKIDATTKCEKHIDFQYIFEPKRGSDEKKLPGAGGTFWTPGETLES